MDDDADSPQELRALEDYCAFVAPRRPTDARQLERRRARLAASLASEEARQEERERGEPPAGEAAADRLASARRAESLRSEIAERAERLALRRRALEREVVFERALSERNAAADLPGLRELRCAHCGALERLQALIINIEATVVRVRNHFNSFASPAELKQFERRYAEAEEESQIFSSLTEHLYQKDHLLFSINGNYLRQMTFLESLLSNLQEGPLGVGELRQIAAQIQRNIDQIQDSLSKQDAILEENQKTISDMQRRTNALLESQEGYYAILREYQAECRLNENLENQLLYG